MLQLSIMLLLFITLLLTMLLLFTMPLHITLQSSMQLLHIMLQSTRIYQLPTAINTECMMTILVLTTMLGRLLMVMVMLKDPTLLLFLMDVPRMLTTMLMIMVDMLLMLRMMVFLSMLLYILLLWFMLLQPTMLLYTMAKI